jgi:hypothetical protein
MTSETAQKQYPGNSGELLAWQPIETAPTDGSEIVAWEPQGGAWIVRWSARLGWRIKAVTGDPIVTIYPSGWMRLPEPPQ